MRSEPLDCKRPPADDAALYELLVSNLADTAVYLLDIDGCILNWNPGIRRILGYTEEQWIGHLSKITFIGDDGEQASRHELVTARERDKSVTACWQLCANGERLYAECIVATLRGRSGELLGYSRMVRDLTTAIHRETELKDALLQSESILHTLREALLTLDGGFRIRFVNAAFHRNFLTIPTELLGRSLYEISGGAWNMPVIRELLEETLSLQPSVSDLEVHHTFPRIGRRILLLNVRRIALEDNGDRESILIAIDDVTERRTSERALQSSEAQRRLIMDSAPAIISYIDCSLRFRYLNRAYERWFGRSQSELLGRQISELFDPDTLIKIRPNLDRVLNGETVTFESDYTSGRVNRTLQVTYTPDLEDKSADVRGFMVLGIDVTARRTAELALKQSEERWRGLFERMTEGFFVAEMRFDTDGRPYDFQFLEVNPAFQAHTGLRNVSGRTCRDVIPDIEQEPFDRFGQVVTTGQSQHFEIKTASLNSWFEVRARHTEGLQFAVLFLNITERKSIEDQVREGERRQEALIILGDRLREIQDVPALAYAAMEIVGQTLHVGRAGFGRVSGSPLQIVIDHDWTDDLTPTLAGTYHFQDYGNDLGPSLQRGEVVSVSDVESDPLTAQTSRLWTQLGIRAFVNVPLMAQGRLDAVLFIHSAAPRIWTESDLSFIRKVADRTWAAAERSRALEELQQSEEFTRSILASSPDCVKVLDLAGRIVAINQGGCNQMEINDIVDVRGKVWVDGWADSKADAAAAVELAQQGETSRFEGFCPTAKGTPKWWEVVVTPVRNSAGEPVRILAISRDISERRTAERDRERLTAELKRSNEDLSQFAHTVAHDLQAPLRGIAGFAQLLQRNATTRLSDTDNEFISHITESARHMADLVSALLRFAQLGQGTLALNRVPMEAVLDAALEGLRMQLSESGVILHRSNLPEVIGDFVQLVQLLQNLIANAIKYSRPGEPPVIHVAATRGPGFHTFHVADNGEGIGDKYLQTIFEPLRRLHGAEIPGTGLGLSMCQRIVQRHGGQIWVESQIDLGSTFYFALPSP